MASSSSRFQAALLDDTVTNAPNARNSETGEVRSLAEENKALIDEWQKTGEHPGLDEAIDADGNIYERIDGEWLKVQIPEDLHGEMQVNGERVKVYRDRCDLPSSNHPIPQPEP